MTKNAAVRFSGICTHVTQKTAESEKHRVMLADVSDPETYAAFPRLAGLPPHTARLLVNQKNLANREEVLEARSGMPFEAVGDSWSWRLNGVQIHVSLHPPARHEPLWSSPTWRQDVPSLHHYAPLATGEDRPLAEPLEPRAAAMLDVTWGGLVPVNFDPRSGGSGVDWQFKVEGSQVQVRFSRLSPKGTTPVYDPLTLLLNVPEASDNGAVEPLIQIENVGTTKDDDRDFLFHYYALFAFVPENATPPRNAGMVESGIGAGCSNSSYP